MKLNKFNKKIFLLIISVISILLMRINIVQAVKLNAEGSDYAKNTSCKLSFHGCIHYVGFEISIVQYTGNKYKQVKGTKKYRIYTGDVIYSKYELDVQNPTGLLNKIQKNYKVNGEYGGLFDYLMSDSITGGINLGADFYDSKNNYAILVKELFGVMYWNEDDGSDCIYYDGVNEHKSSTSENACLHYMTPINYMNDPGPKTYSDKAAKSKIISLLNKDYDYYQFRDIVYNIPCNLTISDGICTNQSETKEDYFNALRNTNEPEYNAGRVWGTAYNKGFLKINKYGETSSEKIKKGTAAFRIYAGSCENKGAYLHKITLDLSKTNSARQALDPGKYAVIEETAPAGYSIDTTCHNVTIKPNITTPVPFYNTKIESCKYDFEQLKDTNNMVDRIVIYEKWLGKKKDYQGLLNLSNKTAKNACDDVEKISDSIGCLQYSKIAPFNAQNLSYYTEKEKDSAGRNLYCIYNFTITNELGNKNFGNVKSGQMVINLKNGAALAKAKLEKICYSYESTSNIKDLQTYRETTLSNLLTSAKKYIKDYTLSFNNKNLNPSINTNEVISKYSLGTNNGIAYTQYNIELTYSYYLGPVYSKFGTGEVVNSSVSSKLLGYGIASKFSDKGKIVVPFQLKFDGTSIPLSTKNECYYNASPELIDPPNSKNPGGPGNSYKLNLEYRQISKSNPFPGKDGTGREVGTNWCDKNNCASTNTVVTNIITNRNDSYNSTGAGPKYVIDLNSASIAQIKSKYGNQAYDDFGTNCNKTNGTCASNFIEWMKSQGYMKVN